MRIFMQWLAQNWLEIVGWTGSALVILSLIVANVRHFRILNLTGALLATFYNILLSIWPYMAMNAAISIIDVYWLGRLRKDQKSGDKTYEVMDLTGTSDLVKRFTNRHREEIVKFYPHFSEKSVFEHLADHLLLTVFYRDEMVGTVIIKKQADGAGEVYLDYVTTAYQDYKCSEVVYKKADLLKQYGLSTLFIAEGTFTDSKHFIKAGFKNAADKLVIAL